MTFLCSSKMGWVSEQVQPICSSASAVKLVVAPGRNHYIYLAMSVDPSALSQLLIVSQLTGTGPGLLSR